MFEGFYGRPQEDLARGSWVPAVDIYSNGQHELVLKAELPDLKEEEIELTVEDNTLTLRGERSSTRKSSQDQFQRIERSYGPFARTFALPPTVDAGKVTAEYKAGVLTVRLPLREEAKPKQSQEFKSPRESLQETGRATPSPFRSGALLIDASQIASRAIREDRTKSGPSRENSDDSRSYSRNVHRLGRGCPRP